MPASDYLLLWRYWRAEPWGPWRDNVHAAILAREIRRPYLKEGAHDELENFMLIDPEVRRRNVAQRFVQFMKSIAKRRRRDVR